MRKITALLLLCCIATFAHARDGYKVTLKLSDVKDSLVYLAHYYGKGFPTIYRQDSAILDHSGNAVFQSTKKLTGGIYIVYVNGTQNYFEMLLDNGDEFSINAKLSKMPAETTIKGSAENDHFKEFIAFQTDLAKDQQGFSANLAKAKTPADTAAIRAQQTANYKKDLTTRHEFEKKYAGTLLAAILNAMERPEVPEGIHKLPDGKVDSFFAYHYTKEHYWDGFNFQDDRLIYTPIFEAKLKDYMATMVVPAPDSFERESDTLLARSRGTQDVFKYTLSWLTHEAETSKYMGMDAAFVYLVNEYYAKGAASWLPDSTVEKYITRANAIAPNMLGTPAVDLAMKDTSGKLTPLSAVDSKYTVVIFWEPSCGHCQHEVPLLDSAYRASLKAKGVKIYAVRTDDPVEQWKKYIHEHQIGDWINVYDPERTVNYHTAYDVNVTPTIYLLRKENGRQVIRGKKLDHSNIGDVIDMLERKDKTAALDKKN